MALLAITSLTHTLVLSVRRHRRPLAVLKSLGFTRPPVRRVVAVHATLLAGTALVVGIPLGVGAARWSWRVITSRLGVVDVPVLPVWAVLATTGAVLVANLVALGPGWRAARTSTAAALQVGVTTRRRGRPGPRPDRHQRRPHGSSGQPAPRR